MKNRHIPILLFLPLACLCMNGCEKTTYVVSFDAKGGSPVPSSQAVKDGDFATRPETDPELYGYRFLYWSYRDAEWHFETDPVRQDLPLMAVYERIAHQVSVTYDETQGSVSGIGVYYIGETVTLTATPNEGYTFKNWLSGETVLSTETEYSFTMGEEDVTLTAEFTDTEYHGGWI